MRQDASIEIDSGNGHESTGRLAKIYPEIDNGRVIADVEVENLPTTFVNKRLLVRVPVGERDALLLPLSALTNRFGVDYVTVKSGERAAERAVVTAKPILFDGKEMTEILTGLAAGEEVLLP